MGKKKEEEARKKEEEVKRKEEEPKKEEAADRKVETDGLSRIVNALTEGNGAMRVAYDAEYTQRLQLVRENESMERETLSLEVEIKGLTDQGEDLDQTVHTLTGRRDGLKETVGDLTSERDTLAAQNKEFAELQQRLDDEVARLKRLQDDYMQAVGKFREARKKIAG